MVEEHIIHKNINKMFEIIFFPQGVYFKKKRMKVIIKGMERTLTEWDTMLAIYIFDKCLISFRIDYEK